MRITLALDDDVANPPEGAGPASTADPQAGGERRAAPGGCRPPWREARPVYRVAPNRSGLAPGMNPLRLYGQGILVSVLRNAEVFWSDGDRLKGEFSNFAVTLAVESVAGWLESLEELVAKLGALRTPFESPLLVPVLLGRTVRLYSRQLISQLQPVTDFGEFEQVLPLPVEERLAGEVVAALSALQECSALSVLGYEGDLDDQVADFIVLTSQRKVCSTVAQPPRWMSLRRQSSVPGGRIRE